MPAEDLTASTRAKAAHMVELLEMERERDPARYAAMLEGVKLITATLREVLDHMETMFEAAAGTEPPRP